MAAFEHNCVDEKCKGKIVNGLKLECGRCKKSWFLDCLLEKSENNIFDMVKATKLVVIAEDDKDKYDYNVTTETIQTFNKIMGKDSSIEFACNVCKNKETKIEKENEEMKREIKRLKIRLEEEGETLREVNERNEKICEAINEKTELFNS